MVHYGGQTDRDAEVPVLARKGMPGMLRYQNARVLPLMIFFLRYRYYKKACVRPQLHRPQGVTAITVDQEKVGRDTICDRQTFT